MELRIYCSLPKSNIIAGISKIILSSSKEIYFDELIAEPIHSDVI